MAVLPDAVRTVNCLGLDRWVPPGIEDEYIVGRRQVQSMPARLEADEKQRALGVLLKALDPLLPIPCAAVEILVDPLLAIDPIADDRQERRELREDERLVSFVDNFAELLHEHVELGTGFIDRISVN